MAEKINESENSNELNFDYDDVLKQVAEEIRQAREYVKDKRTNFRTRLKLYNNQRKQKDKIGDTDELLNELYDFPSAKHDDLSDAESYGPDIIVVPLADEERHTAHHTPNDDPFESDKVKEQDFVQNFVGAHDDADPFA